MTVADGHGADTSERLGTHRLPVRDQPVSGPESQVRRGCASGYGAAAPGLTGRERPLPGPRPPVNVPPPFNKARPGH